MFTNHDNELPGSNLGPGQFNTFLPYQDEWLKNPARFKIGLWARQTGKDFTCAAEAVWNCLEVPHTMWLILGASERQALESIGKARDWALLFTGDFSCEFRDFAPDQLQKTPVELLFESKRKRLNANAPKFAAGKITFANGSRIIALPANAQTIRGYSANLILTEFAFHEDAEGIWRAIYPSISNPMRGGLKKVRIISTPNGLNNKFAQLWHGADQVWFKSRVTLEEAVAQGLPVDLEQVRAGLNDPQAWAQEYECEFMDTSSVLLPYELIAGCESSEATEASNALELSKCRGQLFAGIDFGRKQHLTVCWIFERSVAPTGQLAAAPRGQPGVAANGQYQLITREVLTLRDMSTPEQIAALRPRLQRVVRACVDYTGAGIGLGDYLAREFGEYNGTKHQYGRVELCQFTNALKGELFPKLRVAFEGREIKIPVSVEIREDLHGVQRMVSGSGQVSYRALSKADGHSDRCTALALAVRAAGTMHTPRAALPMDWRQAAAQGHGHWVGKVYGRRRRLLVI